MWRERKVCSLFCGEECWNVVLELMLWEPTVLEISVERWIICLPNRYLVFYVKVLSFEIDTQIDDMKEQVLNNNNRLKKPTPTL